MKKLLLLILPVLFWFHANSQIVQLNKLSQINFATSCAGVWHYVDDNGREYALLGNGDGIVIVDVTDPVNPVVLFTVPAANSLWRELKTYGHYAYAGTEGGGGITIIDLTDLPNSYISKIYDGDGVIAGQISSSHTVGVFGDFLYIFGSNIANGGAVMCSLVDPWNPVYVGSYTNHYLHDGFVMNDTLYSSEIYQGQFSVVDVTDKTNPVVLQSQSTPGAFNHNSWLSDNKQYLYTTDEVNGSPLGVFDISDLQNIQLVNTFYNDTLPGKEVHNVRVFNDYLINPSYGSQLTIVDAARPENLIEIARFQTGTNLCWDASPFLPSGNIIATDISGAFYVFAPYYVRGCYLEGNVTDLITGFALNGVSIKILGINKNTTSNVTGDYKTGYPTAGTYDVEFSKGGYITQVVNGVVLTNGVLTTVDVQLQSFNSSGLVIDNVSGLPVPFAQVRAQNGISDILLQADASGMFQLNSIVSGMWTFTAGKWGYQTNCLLLNVGVSNITIPVTPGIYDDFTFDFGWTISGNAVGGIWVKGEPAGTFFGTIPANPDFDVTNDCSDECFVTGNGGVSLNFDDVDDGTTILTSPSFDVTTFNDPYINYATWFYEQFSTSIAANDTMFISVSNGTTTYPVQSITGNLPTNSSWQNQSFRILDYTALSANTQIIVSISDKIGSGNPLEGAFDKFFVSEGPTGISFPVANENNFSIYPNPASENFEIKLPVNISGNVNIIISDISGREISNSIMNASVKIIIPSNGLSKGIYFISVRNQDKIFTSQKLVKL